MRSRVLFSLLAALAAAAPLAAQQAAPPAVDGPWWWRAFVFVVSLPYTLYMIFVEGERMQLLPAPLLGAAACLWSFLEWRRQRFWTPRLVHIMAGLALATIILINVDWVLAGGEMWLQRYVVIAIFGLFPYVAYLLFLGPRYLGRRHAPRFAPDPLPEGLTATGVSPTRGSKAPARARMTRVYLYAGAAAVVVVVAASAMGSGSAGVSTPELTAAYDGLRNPELVSPGARGIVYGDPDAPVTIVEFGDYQCPACASFATRFKPQVDSAFVTTGRARFLFYDLPLTSLHDNAVIAARAAHCAGDQDRFWDYHEELFREQSQWAPLALPAQAFVGYAASLGLNADEFGTCLSSGRHSNVVDANDALGAALGINSTPTILIMVDGGGIWRARAYNFQTVASTFEAAVAAVP